MSLNSYPLTWPTQYVRKQRFNFKSTKTSYGILIFNFQINCVGALFKTSYIGNVADINEFGGVDLVQDIIITQFNKGLEEMESDLIKAVSLTFVKETDFNPLPIKYKINTKCWKFEFISLFFARVKLKKSVLRRTTWARNLWRSL